VAAFGAAAEAFLPELEKLTAAGVIFDIPDRSLNGLERVRRYAAFIRKFKPDVIFGHSALPALYGRLAVILAGSKAKFVSVLHSGTDDYGSWKLRWAERILRSRTDKIIAVSQSAADAYLRRLKSAPPLTVVLNGVDLDRFYAARERRTEVRAALGLASNEKLLLQVGRISPVKQQRFTLKALVSALREDPGLRLWFAGIIEDVDYAAAFDAEIAEADLGERVRFLGPRLDVPDLLSACDVYLMPSLSEAHSIAFLEAMASGPPIVASAIESFQFAKDLDGVSLLDLGDKEAFLESITRYLKYGERRVHNMEFYDLRKTAISYLEIANSL
jgi:glycosyltransferase involved in cell wall biosynthesis